MIYTKKANFPYPILMNFSSDYLNPEFEMDVTLSDSTSDYVMDVSWSISSDFLKALLQRGDARLVLIIKAADNQFHYLPYIQHSKVRIPKTRLYLSSRTVVQLMIQTTAQIDFGQNEDLAPFYDEIKSEISVHRGNALGFSNTVVFDGTQRKPFELFEKKIDSSISSDVEIRLGQETILIVYKNEKLQFANMQNSKELNYPYLYMGLQKALMTFLVHANPENPEEGVQLDEMQPPENSLESKLFVLMQSKNIAELNMNNIDEVIYQISDKLMDRYSEVIRGIQNGD